MRAIIFSMIWGLFSVVFLFAFVSEASDVNVGVPAYGGNGCPAGSTSVAVSPDGEFISVLFDQMAADGHGQTIDRKSCNFAIPVDVRDGYQVALTTSTGGFVSLRKGARAIYSQEIFYAGSSSPVLSRDFLGPLDDNFIVEDDFLAQQLEWTPCGASVNLRANLSLLTHGNGYANLNHLYMKVLVRRCR